METKKQIGNENRIIANQLREWVLDKQTHKYFEKHKPNCKYGMLCSCPFVKITYTQLVPPCHELVYTLSNKQYKLYLIEKAEVISFK